MPLEQPVCTSKGCYETSSSNTRDNTRRAHDSLRDLVWHTIGST